MDINRPPASIVDGEKPRSPSGLLSRGYKDRLIERAFLGLYRWYTDRSQRTRNWNPDQTFDWRNLRHDLSDEAVIAIQGFFAVEQYAPDFTSRILQMVRRSHGRSHFQMRWGSEEEKHADTWENTLLFSRRRSPAFIEEYKYQLRAKEWTEPWGDALHILVYTVFQERATQLNYLNLAKIAEGKSEKPQHAGDADPVLAHVSRTIAVDEAAHYNFFLEGVRLFLYYYPQETLEAIGDVVGHFAMPASEVIPDWDRFSESVYRSGIYGPREYARDVVQVVFNNLGIESRRALESGIKRTRLVPTDDGRERQLTTLWDTFDYGQIEGDVKRLHDKIAAYEAAVGFDEVTPFSFFPNPAWPDR